MLEALVSTEFWENQSTYVSLVSLETNETIVSFRSNKEPVFNSELLKTKMMTKGIEIPEDQRDNYDSREIVFLEDPNFQTAFREIYSPRFYAPPKYEWLCN